MDCIDLSISMLEFLIKRHSEIQSSYLGSPWYTSSQSEKLQGFNGNPFESKSETYYSIQTFVSLNIVQYNNIEYGL